MSHIILVISSVVGHSAPMFTRKVNFFASGFNSKMLGTAAVDESHFSDNKVYVGVM